MVDRLVGLPDNTTMGSVVCARMILRKNTMGSISAVAGNVSAWPDEDKTGGEKVEKD